MFVNDGEKVFTLRIFPEKKEESFLALESNQKLNIQVNRWSLREWDYKFLV
ncbi:hypothetical protein [Fervidibacillus albus]|uniref:Uncharacterized protein n=1 Tax=Fervidibacillus albus TaxID=2980026 RepID=A0A9E8LX43_9BACI|nr:hypothetical protein [Fervidibacillus albus]WAA11179.1 hypothetical protein OE104_00985 [Fervidibacillus albus]